MRRKAGKRRPWCFEPSYLRPPVVPRSNTVSEAAEAYQRTLKSSWFKDMTIRSACPAPPGPELAAAIAAAKRTHDRVFGTGPPTPPVVHRRHDAGDINFRPQWTPRDNQPRPPSVDEFTRTRRNVHGDGQPTLQPEPSPAELNKPQTSFLYHPQPLCRCHPDTPTSPVDIAEFERTRYNVIGPQSPAPLRLPARPDDFANTSRDVFGPNTPPPPRLPQRTSDFDDTRRDLFGPHTPLVTRPSLRPHEKTFDDLFGKTPPHAPRTVATPPQMRHSMNIFSMTGRQTPPRRKPRPENSFENTYRHVLGRATPVIRESQHRQVARPNLYSENI